MTPEEQTREEIIRAMTAQSQALELVCHALRKMLKADGDPLVAVVAPPVNVVPVEEVVKAPRKPKPAKPVEVRQEITEPETPAEKMKEIKPVKASKTAGDLRVALQECITKHGMAEAKVRLAPYAKLSDVPDEALAETIKRLSAEKEAA